MDHQSETPDSCRRERSRLGASLLEVIITILLGSLVLGVAFGVLSQVRHHFRHGTVNLQNLQAAQLAMNSIRRDFFSSCPFFGQEGKTFEDFRTYERTRRRMFDFGSETEKSGLGKNKLITINGNRMEFYRFLFDFAPGESSADAPVLPVQKVVYSFDPERRVLTREVGNRETKSYHGIEEVTFRLYVHELQPEVPLLHVTLVVHEGSPSGPVSSVVGKRLELASSITSAYLNSSAQNLDWNYEVVHRAVGRE
jgi:type II secretory pathway component PulJ